MKKILSLFVLIGFVLIAPAQAHAADRDPLVKLLIKKGVITEGEVREMEAELAAQEKATSAAQPTAAPAKQEIQAAVKEVLPDWVKKTTWSGDLRLRHETQFRDPSVDRNRERFRLRFGFKAQPWNPLEIGVQLGTGTSGDPISNNQTFTSTFDKKAIFVDKAYAKYTPWSWVSFVGGKMDNPYRTTDIVWDPDVTPEGVAIQMKSPGGIPGLKEWLAVRPFANVGAFPISELNTTKGHPAIYGFQGGADIDLPCGLVFQPSVGYYDFQRVKGMPTSTITGSPAGNTTFTSGGVTRLAYDYNIVDILGRLTIPEFLGQPVALVGDYVFNTAYSAPDSPAGKLDNKGAWQAGVEVGKVTEKFGSWKATYYFKRLESNAVFGALTDSDFGAGGTNHFGHILGVQMGLNKWASVGLKYYRTDEIIGSQNRNDTLQADLNLKY